MKHSSSRDLWWKKLSDGKPRRRMEAPGSGSIPASSDQPKPYDGLVTDAVGTEAQAQQDFHQAQLQSGLDILRENKPIDTVADLACVELARQTFADPLAQPLNDPFQPDPLTPGPMDPKPGG